MVIFGCLIFAGFFSGFIYPNLEYKGYPRNSSCTGECYAEYVRVHGTVVEQLQKQQAAAAEDPFSSIRGLWAGCAACINIKIMRQWVICLLQCGLKQEC